MEPIVIVGATVVACYAFRSFVDTVRDLNEDGTWTVLMDAVHEAMCRLRHRLDSALRGSSTYPKGRYGYAFCMATRTRRPGSRYTKPGILERRDHPW